MRKKNIVCIVQARTQSTRFPEKILKNIRNLSLIEILIMRLKKSKKINQLVLATTKNKSDNILEKIARKRKISFFRGPSDDVLKRYYLCAKKFDADIVVRITSDCPLIDSKLMDNMIEKFYELQNADYFSNTIKRTFPDGLDIEIFTFEALKKTNKNCKNKKQREHVTPYLLNSKIFKIKNLEYKKNLSQLRWTLDERDDFDYIKKIFLNFENIYFSYEEVIKLLKKKPHLNKINSSLSLANYSDLNKGQKVWRRALGVIPGGNMFFSKNPNIFLPNFWPTYFSKAKGYKIWDLDGKMLSDFSFMGVGTNILGYANPEVNSFVMSKLKQGNVSTLNSIEDILLSEKLIDIHPWSEMVKLCRTGADAAAIAIRISRAYNKKNKVIVCGYHGWHDWYLAANLKNKNNLDEHLIAGIGAKGVLKDLKNSTLQFSYNDFNTLESLVNNNKDITALIMEVKRNKKPKNNFLKKVRNLTSKKNITLIFDECTSGFRSTMGGLHMYYDIEPDICLFGKALGNGYPINAVIGKRDIMKVAEELFISSTFWSEKLGPSAALKTIEIMERDKSYEYIKLINAKVKNIWKKTAKLHNIDIQIEGMDGIPSFKFNYKDNLAFKTFLTQEMLKKNILATNSVYLSISHDERLISMYQENLDKIFRDIKKCIDEKLNINDLLIGPISKPGLRQRNYA